MTSSTAAGGVAKPQKQKQINLLRGWPNPSLLPTSLIATASTKALQDPEVAVPGLLYGPDPGYQPLREEIAGWMARFYGDSTPRPINTSPQVRESSGGKDVDAERICITGGASQNLACVLQVFSDPLRTKVWMVAPCYFLACRIFGDSGLVVRAVGEGDEGVDLESLERGLREREEELEREGERKALKQPRPWSKIYRNIIYCVPTFSNPSGKTMTLSCRQKLVQLARKYDALIVTDDVYDCLQWPTSSKSSTSLSKAILPRLVDIDRTLEPVPGPESFGNAMSNGSFSKIAGPGVRTGWAESTPKFVYGLSQCGSSRSGGAPSQLVATMMAELLRSGELERHIKEVLNPEYERRYGITMRAIQKYLAPLGIRAGEVAADGKDIFGGYFLWLELPSNVSAEVVADRAKVEENLIVAPGYIFEVENDPSIKFPNSLRLCFAWEGEADLKEGIERLARVVGKVRDGVPPEAKGEGLGKNGVKGEMGEFR
ncbi:PLP-dependent transferase [Stipitochalara longipes BDJ]|nr:PLP-dependent transferase [Stipitochalara longipes BDJ]